MAEALAGAGIGHNLSRASFLDFNTKHNEIERELAEVAETRRSLNRRRKDLRKNMEAAGIDIAMFDRVLLDVELLPAEREAQDREYRRMMEWRNAPPGFQPSIDLQTDDEGLAALNEYELHAIDGEGFDSGRAGHPAQDNPHRPGSEAHQRWSNAWIRGQAAKVAATGNGAANGQTAPLNGGSAPAEEAPKRRGRPPGGGRKRAEKDADDSTAAHDRVFGEPNEIARQHGRQDGQAGVRDHAARYPQGEPGHGDYMLGRAEGEEARQPPLEETAAEGDPAPQEA